ncbi:MAG: hypothetical protein Q4G00_03505 [Clostridia bacterium]|nr:hypothetical protein [Clostridia bacterium]
MKKMNFVGAGALKLACPERNFLAHYAVLIWERILSTFSVSICDSAMDHRWFRCVNLHLCLFVMERSKTFLERRKQRKQPLIRRLWSCSVKNSKKKNPESKEIQCFQGSSEYGGEGNRIHKCSYHRVSWNIKQYGKSSD